MYCSCCGTPVIVNMKECPSCSMPINPKLFTLEPDKTAKDLIKIDIKENKTIAFLSYLGPLVLLTLTKAKSSDFVKFHSNQGLLSFIALIVSCLLLIVPNYGYMLGITAILLSLSLSVLGSIKVFKEEKKELPLIGKYKIIK